MSTAAGRMPLGTGVGNFVPQPIEGAEGNVNQQEQIARPSRLQRIIESRRAQVLGVTLSALALAVAVAKGATTEATLVAGNAVPAGSSAGKTGGEAPAAPGAPQTPEAKTGPTGICRDIDTAKLLESMGIPPKSMPIDKIACDSKPKAGTALASTPLTGYGRWDFPKGKDSSYMNYIEIATVDDRANGASVFTTLKPTYNGKAQTKTLGGVNVQIVTGSETFSQPDGTRSGAGKLLVNVPEANVDILMSSSSAYATDPQVVIGLNEANELALASLLPTIIARQ